MGVGLIAAGLVVLLVLWLITNQIENSAHHR